MEEVSEKEKRIRAITKLYYSNPKVQQAILEFAKDREVVPRYFEGFGKRPDTLQYNSDIMGLVNKGATSFHASEEIWNDPLAINSDMTHREMSENRKAWDLLIDIDSPFLDYSIKGAKLLIEQLESFGITSYGIKFSGSKGMHIVVPSKAFPEEFQGLQTKNMFPEWPRAIVSYLMQKTKKRLGEEIKKEEINFEAIQERMNLSEKELVTIQCPNCNNSVDKSNFVYFECEKCSTPYQRPHYKVTAKKLRCTDESCSGFMKVVKEEDYFFCDKCKTKLSTNTDYKGSSRFNSSTVESRESKMDLKASDFKKGLESDLIVPLDLILVASRHLFRMPYSLHEKTSLSSVVIDKEELDSFTPANANPLKVIIKPFYKDAVTGEATRLLEEALKWKEANEPKEEKKRISEEFVADYTGVTEDMYPQSIKKLLKGLPEGRKRGLFVLLTFLRCLNYPDDYVSQKIRDWNKLNDPPLKEGYVKSQLDWHSKQKKKILPPNYSNDAFYKDLKLIDKAPDAKNPLVEVSRKLRRSNSNQ